MQAGPTNVSAELRKEPFTFRQRTLSNFFWLARHLLSPRLFESLLGGGERRLHQRLLSHLERRGPGSEVEVPRLEDIGPSQFKKNFYKRGIPVILAGAAKHWRCCGLWSPEYFAEHYGEVLSSVTDYGEDEESRLSDTVRLMREGKLRASHFSKVVHNSPELLAQLDLSYLEPFRSRFSHRTSYQFFMGPKGAKTAIHAGGTNNFHIQIYGEKTWRMVDTRYNPVMCPHRTRSPLLTADYDPTISPDKQHTFARYIDVYRAKLYPGDILYVPTFYWHHVSYDTDSIASGVRWFAPADVADNFTMFLIMMTATNPTVFEYYLDITRGRLNRFFGSKRREQLVR